MVHRISSAPRMRLAPSALAGLLACAAPALVLAAESGVEPISFDDGSKVANDADQDIELMRRDLDFVAKGYVVPVGSDAGRVERRLREGEIHYLLSDFLRASIVLLDVADDPANRTHPRYDDAIYLLADSLRKSKNYSGSRKYFEEIMPRAKGDRLKDCVLALLEIASATDHYEDVERYIGRLREAGTLSRPDVDYIYGKMLFKGGGNDPGKIGRAYEVFHAIPTGDPVSGYAAYYAGVALVKLGRYDDAIRQFAETLNRLPKGKEGEQLKELTYLSLGRLYQELGDQTKSADAYQEIPQSSPYFGDTLYEVAWTHVKQANAATDPEQRRVGFVRGLRTTELLMATGPDARLYPQARILEGNLQIRLGAPESAYDTFQTIIDRYGAAKEKLATVIASTPDPKQFFDQLIATDLGQIGGTSILPPVVLTWALGEPEMSRAVSMSQELSQSKKFMDESKELVGILSEAMKGEQRFGMFSSLRPVRAKALSTENRLVNVNRRLLNLERRMVWPYVSAEARAAIDAAHQRVTQLEPEVQSLPQTEKDVETTSEQIKNAYQETGRRAYKQAYRLSTMRAQVVAVEKWINANRESMTPEMQSRLEERFASARQELSTLEQQVEGLEGDIRAAQALSGVDPGRARARKVASTYSALVAQEIALLKSHHDRVPPQLAGLTTRIDQERASLEQIDQQLQQLEGNLEHQVDKKSQEIKAAIAAEVDHLAKYETEYAQLVASTDQMLGPIATRTLGSVDNQFKDFVLQADVGIIDVAWARKQAETKKVSDLIKEQQDRTLELESEFADVLEEQ